MTTQVASYQPPQQERAREISPMENIQQWLAVLGNAAQLHESFSNRQAWSKQNEPKRNDAMERRLNQFGAGRMS